MNYLWKDNYTKFKKELIENLSLPIISESDKQRYLNIFEYLEKLMKSIINKVL